MIRNWRIQPHHLILLLWLPFCGAIAGSATQPAGARGDDKNASARSLETRQIEMEGNVICLPERMHDLYQTELPSGHTHVYAFETTAGEFYAVLRTRFSEALFADSQVQKKRLLLKGRVFPRSQVFDVTHIRSLRDGVVYDLFYYCTVCAIETVAPGPCPCCQGTVELRERPLKSGR